MTSPSSMPALGMLLAALVSIVGMAQPANAQITILSRSGELEKTSAISWWPAKSPEDADALFESEGFESIGAVGLSFARGGAAFYSEFLSDNLAISARLGYGRVGFGAFVQSGHIAGDDDSDTTSVSALSLDGQLGNLAAERFFAAGGNTMMYYALPVVRYDASFNNSDANTIIASLNLFPRAGFDIPALNPGAVPFSGNLDLGTTATLVLHSHREVFNIFGQLRLGWVPIASADFYDQLGVSGAFSYASLEGGVVLADLIRVVITGPLAAPSALMERTPVMVGLQLIPIRSASAPPEAVQ